MASTVKEEHIEKLRGAGYLSSDIAHRLPDKGQLIPTPGPHERVVFLTHFLRGLRFPLHPFVRGLIVGVKTGGSRVGGPELCV